MIGVYIYSLFQDWYDHPQHKKLIDTTSVRLDLSIMGIIDLFCNLWKWKSRRRSLDPPKKRGLNLYSKVLLDVQTTSDLSSPDKAFMGPKHLLTRYLRDFGRLGHLEEVNPRFEGLVAQHVVKSPRLNDQNSHVHHLVCTSPFLRGLVSGLDGFNLHLFGCDVYLRESWDPVNDLYPHWNWHFCIWKWMFWKTILSFWEGPFFRSYVSFREGIICKFSER